MRNNEDLRSDLVALVIKASALRSTCPRNMVVLTRVEKHIDLIRRRLGYVGGSFEEVA